MSGLKRSGEFKEHFHPIYNAFVRNREKLLDELEEIADKAVDVKKDCALSNLAGSGVGAVGGVAAVAGLVAFPPLLLAGVAAAGFAAVWNIGTYAAEYKMTSDLSDEVRRLGKKDAKLLKELNDVYQIGMLIFADDLEHAIEEMGNTGEQMMYGITLSAMTAKLKMMKHSITLGDMAAESKMMSAEEIAVMAARAGGEFAEITGAEAIGGALASVGRASTEVGEAVAEAGALGLTPFGASIAKGVAHAALGIFVPSGVVPIIFSANANFDGSPSKFCAALLQEVKRRREELAAIRNMVRKKDLFGRCL